MRTCFTAAVAAALRPSALLPSKGSTCPVLPGPAGSAGLWLRSMTSSRPRSPAVTSLGGALSPHPRSPAAQSPAPPRRGASMTAQRRGRGCACGPRHQPWHRTLAPNHGEGDGTCRQCSGAWHCWYAPGHAAVALGGRAAGGPHLSRRPCPAVCSLIANPNLPLRCLETCKRIQNTDADTEGVLTGHWQPCHGSSTPAPSNTAP